MANLKILCIDDDANTRNVIGQALTLFGHTVFIAEDGRTGIDKFKECSTDLVIVDRTMPQLSGDAVAAEIKAINADVPIIMLTGDAEAMKNNNECPPHVDMLLGKPVALTELRSAVDEAVGQ